MSKQSLSFPLLKWRLLFLSFTLLFFGAALAQNRVISGKIVDAKGNSLGGANISEKGSNKGVIADAEGNFSLTISKPDAILVISFVGYATLEIPVKGQTFINATLQSGSGTLSGIVVTALGITRNKRSLGYDVGQINGEDVNHVAQTNVLNAMAGRVSGVAINSTGASPTSSVSIVIRGTRSLNNDNQPLFVIDGVPVKNSLNNVNPNNGDGNDVDYGNTISDIDPNDVESVSILKGPSAAALYGSRAGNGVVLITTKSGKKSKGIGVSFSSTDEAAIPYHYFPLNLSYTVGSDPYTTPNVNNSINGVIVDLAGTNTYRFGTPLNKGINAIQLFSPVDANGNYTPLPMVSHNNLKNFVQTGLTTINSLSVENATDKTNYRFSYSNTYNKAIVPTIGLMRHNLALNVEQKISNGVKLSTSINYARSNADNIVTGNSNGIFANVAYTSPSVDIRQLKNYWITPGIQQKKDIAPALGYDPSEGDENPWFFLNQVKNGFLRNHLFGNVKASFTFSPHVSAFLRYSQDLAYENRETKISKSSVLESNGYYGLTNLLNSESNTDFLVTYHNVFLKDFDISASGGGNILYDYSSSNQVYSKPQAGIIVPELFNVSNIAQANVAYNSGKYEKAIYSLYATVSLGYKDFAYLDLTGRNDWSSTLPLNNNSYFYPSASLSLLINKIFHMSEQISLLKVRGGIATVGKDTDPYNLYGSLLIGNYGGTTTESLSGTLLNPNLVPEKATSKEIGVDLALFKNRLRFEGTIYRSDNRNQVLSATIPGSSGYTGSQFNAGLIRSNGIELQIGGTIISNKDWTWDLSVNYTKNNAYIISLAPGTTYFTFWQTGASGSWTYAKGQPIPNLFDAKGNQVISDGKIGQLWDNKLAIVEDKSSPYYGYPLLDDGGILQKDHGGDFQHKTIAGNFNPKLMMGFQTAVSWKFLTLTANVDMRLGGLFYSNTYRYMESDAALKRQENVGIPIPSQYASNIPAYLKSNPDKYIKITGLEQFKLVGGPTQETGGVLNSINGVPIYDGAFYPGVYSDGNGGYVENLGDPNLTKYDTYEDAVTNGPWQFGRMDMFDASYIKLRELSITAQLPKKLVTSLKLQAFSVSLYTRNLIIWTKAKAGVDPELAFQYHAGSNPNGSQFSQGIEYYNITPWAIPLGIKLNVRF